MTLRLKTTARLLWIVTLVCSVAFYARWGRDAYSFYGDALGYYLYLPSTFIYHNHKQVEVLPEGRGIRPFIRRSVAGTSEGRRSPKGHVVYQYTYGVALLEAPAFLVAHAWELTRGGPANGFSAPYQVAVSVMTLLYGLAGLWLVYRFLKRYFEPPVASITTALLLLGTNLFWFVFRQHGMAHVPLFFLFAALLHLTDRVHRQDRRRVTDALGLGVVAGLITLVRPIDGLCVLLPMLYGVGSRMPGGWRAFVRAKWSWGRWAVLAFVLPLLPQLLYWKWLTGSFLYDSYGPGQTLNLLHPHLWRGLFGASNGWLIYTPLLLFAGAGLLWFRRLGGYQIAVPVFLALYTWCVYAWFQPIYNNGLGSRPMVDGYAVWALPLAVCIEKTARSRWWVRGTVALVMVLFTAVSLSYAVQEALGVLWSENSNYAYNRQILFRYRTTYNDLVVWDTGVPQPDTTALRPVPMVARAAAGDSLLQAQGSTRGGGYRVDGEFSPFSVAVAADSVLPSGARWMRASGRFLPLVPEEDVYKIPLLVLEVKRGDGNIAWYGVRINNKVGLAERPELKPGLFTFRTGFWGTASAFLPVPRDLRPGDQIRLFVWNLSREPLQVDGLQLSFYR